MKKFTLSIPLCLCVFEAFPWSLRRDYLSKIPRSTWVRSNTLRVFHLTEKSGWSTHCQMVSDSSVSIWNRRHHCLQLLFLFFKFVTSETKESFVTEPMHFWLASTRDVSVRKRWMKRYIPFGSDQPSLRIHPTIIAPPEWKGNWNDLPFTKVSGNFSWKVNQTRLFRSFQWKLFSTKRHV